MDPLLGGKKGKGQSTLGKFSRRPIRSFPQNLITLPGFAKKKEEMRAKLNRGTVTGVSLPLSAGKLKSHSTVTNTFHSSTLNQCLSREISFLCLFI